MYWLLECLRANRGGDDYPAESVNACTRLARQTIGGHRWVIRDEVLIMHVRCEDARLAGQAKCRQAGWVSSVEAE